MTQDRREFGTLRLRGRIWHIRYKVAGRTYQESSKSTNREDAETLLDQRQSELGRCVFVAPDAKRLGLADLRDLVKRDYRVKRYGSLRTVLQCFGRLERFFGNASALAITTDRVTAYEVDMMDRGYARATINKDLGALRRAFKLAVRARRLPRTAGPEFEVADAG